MDRDPRTADLGHSTLDLERERRCGFPEVIYGAGKTPAQLVDIAGELFQRSSRVLATRVSDDGAAALEKEFADGVWHAEARAFTLGGSTDPEAGEGRVLVVSAGTADGRVAAEAAVTARMMGARVVELRDVGVAGLHRLMDRADELQRARALVVVAGMEGALPSVVGGLVQRPVIAVPTSVGYGSSMGGLAALLGMLNSCAAGVSVVNIDNGFGGGYAAALINREYATTP